MTESVEHRDPEEVWSELCVLDDALAVLWRDSHTFADEIGVLAERRGELANELYAADMAAASAGKPRRGVEAWLAKQVVDAIDWNRLDGPGLATP